MSVIASITVDDAETTPVSHTFNPHQTKPALYVEDGNPAVPIVGQPTILVDVKRAQNGSSVNRVKFTFRVPVLETTSGSTIAGYEAPPKVAHTLTFTGELIAHDRSTEQQRANVVEMVSNLLSNAQAVDALAGLETPY